MTVPARLAAFAALLLLVLGGSALAGAAIDPTGAPPERRAHGATGAHDGGGDAHGAGSGSGARAVHGSADHGGGRLGGLAVAEDGYALELDRTHLPRAASASLRFRIVDGRGRVVRDGFRVEHERELHLVVVRRDTGVFRHVHPRRGRDGTWTVALNTSRPGVYRAYADFDLGDGRRVLGADLFVPGDAPPVPLPAPTRTDRAIDEDDAVSGVDVALHAPDLRAGRPSRLTFRATRGGRGAPLQPYLGARGHLVALREGDLAYLHVHPTSDGGADHDGDDHGHDDADGVAAVPVAPNATSFEATFPTAGRYRLFLQVRTGGRVRTVDHTVDVAR